MNKNTFSGIVIRVKDMDLCRSFYQNVVGLGAPVMDSSFWCEFNINGNSSLYLEKADIDETLHAATGRIAWMLQVPDLPAFTSQMEKSGYSVAHTSADRVGFIVYAYRDPEGNLFYVTEKRLR
ncbi:MAG: hypothetical protein IKB16_05560 [Lentisphaeria bacterium]|nr:hypothetical protein [Lentisphaeria bacterium]